MNQRRHAIITIYTIFTMCLVSFRASGRSEEPAGDRPHHQLPQGALGAGRGQRQAVPDHLRPGHRRNGEHGRFSIKKLHFHFC